MIYKSLTVIRIAIMSFTFFSAISLHAQVQDEANIFSGAAKQEAEKIISTLKARTNPSKTILVRTVSKVTGDPQVVAENYFREAGINGIQIFASTEPRKLIITVGKETEIRFRESTEVREIMLGAFRNGNFDDGLINGLNFISQKLSARFASNGGAAFPASENGSLPVPEESAGSGMPGWLLPAVIIGAVILFSLRRRRPQQVGPYREGGSNPQNTGFGGAQQGTGMGSSILGGIGGALAGNWLYDRFLGGSSTSHAAPHSHSNPDNSHGSNDYGNVGSSESGDWGSSDGGGFDGGSDGGGDW